MSHAELCFGACSQVLEGDTTFYQVCQPTAAFLGNFCVLHHCFDRTSVHTQVLGLVLAQFDGLVAGYHMRHSVDPVAIPLMSRRDFVFLNGNGELYDLIARQPQMPDLAKMAPHELFVRVALAGRCSALITVSRTRSCSCGLLLLYSGLLKQYACV